MKTNHSNSLARLTGMTITIALLAGAGALSAGDAAAGKGGASRLLDVTGRPTTLKAEASDQKPMACAKCKDEFVSRVDWSARGANKPTVTVARHLCGGCDNEWVVSGHGKAKTVAAVHKCNSCGAESAACCATGKAGVAGTKGTEKKFEVAPVK